MRRLALMVVALLAPAAAVACFTPSRPKPTARVSVTSPAREVKQLASAERRASPNDLSVPRDKAWLVVLNRFERRVLVYDEEGRLTAAIPPDEAQILELLPGEHRLFATMKRTIASLQCDARDCGIGTAKFRFEAGCMYFARMKRRPFKYPTSVPSQGPSAYAFYALDLVRESNLATSVWWPNTIVRPPHAPMSWSEFGGAVVGAGNAQPGPTNITWERNDERPLCNNALADAGADAEGESETVDPRAGY